MGKGGTLGRERAVNTKEGKRRGKIVIRMSGKVITSHTSLLFA